MNKLKLILTAIIAVAICNIECSQTAHSRKVPSSYGYGEEYGNKNNKKVNADSLLKTLIDSTSNDSIKIVQGGYFKGNRNHKDIHHKINQNMAIFQKTYNNRLTEKGNLNGGIFVLFKISTDGDIIKSKILKSTMNDTIFENNILDIIGKWKFDKCEYPNDTTEVRYPFFFLH